MDDNLGDGLTVMNQFKCGYDENVPLVQTD